VKILPKESTATRTLSHSPVFQEASVIGAPQAPPEKMRMPTPFFKE
jgi:hypothetical protein